MRRPTLSAAALTLWIATTAPALAGLRAVVTGVSAGQDPPRRTFRAATRLVPVDVIVHDKDNQPVADLTEADFKVFEDGKEQRIELFSVVSARRAKGAAPDPQPRNQVTNRPGGATATTATVVLFDRLNTRFEDQVQARAEIVTFLSGVQPDDRVALYVLESNSIRVLHDFTRDSASLARAMARYRAATSVEQARTDEPVPQFATVGLADIDADTAAWLKETTEMVSAEFMRGRGQLTLAALHAIANHLLGVPGRKNLVWVSSAFPIVITTERGPQSMSAELRDAIRAVNTANISIYPVDTRGLVAPYAGPAATATREAPPRGVARPADSATMATTMPNVDTMMELAVQTGGRAFYNTNAIGQAIRRALDDARVTYVLGYYSTFDNADGKLHRLRVTVRRPDLDVRHRSGYMALPPNTSRASSQLAEVALASLEATGIGLTVSGDVSNATLPVTIRVEPGAIMLKPVGDMWEVALDILIAHSTAGGDLIKHLDTTLSLRLSREQRDEILREGFTMTRTVPVRPGVTRLHASRATRRAGWPARFRSI